MGFTIPGCCQCQEILLGAGACIYNACGCMTSLATYIQAHQASCQEVRCFLTCFCVLLCSTMYWDDRYGTETVSHDVLGRMKQLMVDNNTAASHSFLLDDDSSIPFSLDDISNLMEDKVNPLNWSCCNGCSVILFKLLLDDAARLQLLKCNVVLYVCMLWLLLQVTADGGLVQHQHEPGMLEAGPSCSVFLLPVYTLLKVGVGCRTCIARYLFLAP